MPIAPRGAIRIGWLQGGAGVSEQLGPGVGLLDAGQGPNATMAAKPHSAPLFPDVQQATFRLEVGEKEGNEQRVDEVDEEGGDEGHDDEGHMRGAEPLGDCGHIGHCCRG